MARDAQRILPPDLFEDLFRLQIGADELLQAERDDVRVVLRADVVLRDLGARNDDHAVLPLRARAFLLDVGHVVVERLRRHRKPPPAERRHAPEPAEQILLREDVIGDREHVELFRLPVQIDHLAQRQPPVAPRRVYMEIAQQEGLVSRHVMSGANVFVGGVGRPVEEDLGAEVSHVEAEHLAAPHRLVAARGREDPARLPQAHAARLRDAAGEVRVFAVKLDRRVEAADRLERIAP